MLEHLILRGQPPNPAFNRTRRKQRRALQAWLPARRLTLRLGPLMLDPRCAAIIEAWADDLASVLGRPASEIREKGLYAGDFPQQVLAIEFDDDSSARFRWAFYIESRSKKAIGVFTEHCGYLVLPIAGVKITKGDL
jgi:hypothetical protein